MLTNEDKRRYYIQATKDIEELKAEYPFTKRANMPPTVDILPVELEITAVNKRTIQDILADEEYFLGDYSRKLHVIIPYDYKNAGCKVYGGSWIDTSKIAIKYHHFNGKGENGTLLFCVGVPASFQEKDNVILENIRTAEHMLIAYEHYQKGITKELELIAYSHGDMGVREYEREQKKIKKFKTEKRKQEPEAVY